MTAGSEGLAAVRDSSAWQLKQILFIVIDKIYFIFKINYFMCLTQLKNMFPLVPPGGSIAQSLVWTKTLLKLFSHFLSANSEPQEMILGRVRLVKPKYFLLRAVKLRDPCESCSCAPGLCCSALCGFSVPQSVTQAHKGIQRMITLLSIHTTFPS